MGPADYEHAGYDERFDELRPMFPPDVRALEEPKFGLSASTFRSTVPATASS